MRTTVLAGAINAADDKPWRRYGRRDSPRSSTCWCARRSSWRPRWPWRGTPASITLDYLDLYGLRPAVERVQAAGITARVASPRVLKPNEQRIVNFLLRLDCQILVRSGGLLDAFQEGERPPLIGDFSLNAANLLSAAAFSQLGVERLDADPRSQRRPGGGAGA